MIVRISYYETPLNNIAAVEKWTRESAIPAVRKMGAIEAYWGADRKTGKGVVVAFWKDEETANTAWKDSSLALALRTEVESKFGTTMTDVQTYEVFGQI